MKKAKQFSAGSLTGSLLVGIFFGFLLGAAVPDFEIKIQLDKPEIVSSERERTIFGDENSDLVARIFIDWECPFSQQFWLETLPQIEGVKFELVHFPLAGHENSEDAARAVECAAEQNLAKNFATEILREQKNWDFEEIAESLGLDGEELENCLNKSEIAEQIEADRTLASELKITSSPTFLLENEKIEGAQPLAAYTKIIEKLNGEKLESFDDFLRNSAR